MFAYLAQLHWSPDIIHIRAHTQRLRIGVSCAFRYKYTKINPGVLARRMFHDFLWKQTLIGSGARCWNIGPHISSSVLWSSSSSASSSLSSSITQLLKLLLLLLVVYTQQNRTLIHLCVGFVVYFCRICL